jgi:hypothetical protein
MNEWEEFLRALGGTLLIIGIMVCSVICLYKYAVCQEKKEKSIINVVPRQYSNLESKHNSGVGVIVTPQSTAICSSV